MCGGLTRWLRVFGVDTSYTPGIDDGVLVEHALAEGRLIISADGPLFDRRPLATGQVRGLRLPVGLKLLEQVRYTVRELQLTPGTPRCTACNGELEAVTRAEVADVVPARSLIWGQDFYRCLACHQVFWEGTHWQKIRRVHDALFADEDTP